MKPRRFAVLAALAAVVAAPSSPAAASDHAASVNGVEISVDDFEQALKDLGAGQLVNGGAGRGVLTDLVVDEARRQFLDENPLPDELREEYERTGVADAQICLRFFIVEDEAAGAEAIEQLGAGEDFAAVAAAFDPAQTGRTLTGEPTEPCLPVERLPQGSEAVLEALDESGAGEPAGPVEIETEDVSIVVLAPPWDEVMTSFVDAEAFERFLGDADVTVNPRYGRWDGESLSVVSLGQG